MIKKIIYNKNTIIVFVLLVILFIQCVASMRLKSPTFDEAGHLSSGYSYLKTNDYRLNKNNPPFIKRWMALPLLFMNLNIPLDHPSWKVANPTEFGRQFFYYDNKNADKILFWGRLQTVWISLLLGFFVYKWAKELCGNKAGLLALFLYSFAPNILAHSRLATTDIGFTCFMFIALYYFRRFIIKPSKKNLIIAGIVLGLAFVSKFTAVILIPSFLIILSAYIFVNKTRFPKFFERKSFSSQSSLKPIKTYIVGLIAIFSIGFFVIFIDYSFEMKPLVTEKDDLTKLEVMLNRFPYKDNHIKGKLCNLATTVPLPARTYLTSLGWMSQFTPRLEKDEPVKGHGIFLMGKNSVNGFWYYILVAFLIKTPIPILLLLIIAFLTIKKNDLSELYFLLIPVVLLLLLGLKTNAMAYRYIILPMLPFLYVFVSKVVNIEKIKRKFLVVGLAVLCGWYLFSSLKIYPHYLAYFNEIIGGPKNGYKYLVNSDLDWGQDLKLLKLYMKKNNIGKIKLSYLGTADPDYYNISYVRLQGISGATFDPDVEENPERDTKPTDGIIAISATCLQHLNGFYPGYTYDWLKKYKQIDNIGYSIFIYKI